MKNLTLSAASRKSSSGVSSMNSPRPSISTSSNCSHKIIHDTHMTKLDEECVPNNNFLSTNEKLKDPRVCNERSDSGFSECSNCSTPSASCVCNNLPQIEKSDTIVEEQTSNSNTPSTSSTSTSTIEPGEESQSTNSDHDARSEISSLEYDNVNETRTNCNSNGGDEDIVLSIRVPSRRELYQNEHGVPMSEIERRKVSLENDSIRRRMKTTTSEAAREEFSLEKLKKTSKVALLMEKFELPSSATAASTSSNTSGSFKFKTGVTSNDNDEESIRSETEGLIKSTSTNNSNVVSSITNDVKMCDLELMLSEQDNDENSKSINVGHASNINYNNSCTLVKSPAATRKSTTNYTTTFRLSERVREVTERLSKPKQQATSTSTEKTTKASILTKQNTNFNRSKEFWKR